MSGLGEEFGGKVRGRNVDATTPEVRLKVGRLGFNNHGLIIEDSKGKLLWKQPDHEVEMESVRKAVGQLLEGETPDFSETGDDP